MGTCASKKGVAAACPPPDGGGRPTCNRNLLSDIELQIDTNVTVHRTEEKVEEFNDYLQQVKTQMAELKKQLAELKKQQAEFKKQQAEFEREYFKVPPSYVELVMSQADCPRSVAVKALHENDNDVVEAINAIVDVRL